MRRPISSYRPTQTIVLAAAAALAALVACEMQSPAQPVAKATVVSKVQPIFMPANTVYFEYQVENAVTPAASSVQPRYPDVLRRAGVGGEVLVQFIVNADGTADVASLKVLKSSNDLFTQAVRNTLPQMRFNAARVGGKAVRQLVQAPFSFAMSK